MSIDREQLERFGRDLGHARELLDRIKADRDPAGQLAALQRQLRELDRRVTKLEEQAHG